jgi:hypothetical protein
MTAATIAATESTRPSPPVPEEPWMLTASGPSPAGRTSQEVSTASLHELYHYRRRRIWLRVDSANAMGAGWSVRVGHPHRG